MTEWRLYRGDVREVLPADVQDVAVLLTDPPYAAWGYLRAVEDGRKFDCELDAQWAGGVSAWIGTWWVDLRKRMRPDGVAWVFCNLHYVGFYLRWAYYCQWPLRGIFCCPPNEFLLAFGPETFPAEAATQITAACLGNTYGQGKPVPLLRLLLHYSPPGLVLDPFAGSGSTLLAARAEGRLGVGVEVHQGRFDTTLVRLGEPWSHDSASPGGKSIVDDMTPIEQPKAR